MIGKGTRRFAAFVGGLAVVMLIGTEILGRSLRSGDWGTVALIAIGCAVFGYVMSLGSSMRRG